VRQKPLELEFVGVVGQWFSPIQVLQGNRDNLEKKDNQDADTASQENA
jgi:hypothetical protein